MTLWSPPPDVRDRTRVGAWLRRLEETRRLSFNDYADAWAWSVDDLDGFWSSIVEFFGVRFDQPPTATLGDRDMPGADWFPGATLNYAAHALANAPDGVAVVSVSQTLGTTEEMTGHQLRDLVGQVAGGLQALGVTRGDRVAAYLPNTLEALIGFLAAATLGATWSSCPPEFGPQGVIDRFAQITPRVLLAVDGYRHRGREIDRRADLAAIRAAIPGLEATVHVPYLHDDPLPGTTSWADLLRHDRAGAPIPVAFDHPLYVLYSSGTTGLPKPIVHGHGGILLEHLKALALHHDLGPGSRFFWYSTTGWMMWNYLVSGLVAGASIVLLDGDPMYPDAGALWRLAAEQEITHFGVSAPYLIACAKAGVEPPPLPQLREVGSTGAPLPPEGFQWVHDHVRPSPRVASISGGTDVCTAFVGASPLLPTTKGEISCRCLGCRVEAFDEDGQPLIGEQGTLVVTAPMPSMPTGLWGDADGSRLRAAYYDRFPGVWDHGDWITITERGTCVITGRSDATLNRGGVRLGTAELYRVIEARPEVADSLVVHLETTGQLLLFVVPADGHRLDDALEAQLAGDLRQALSPRHVPDRIIEVAAIPRTLSGKKLELPVKRILSGTPPEQAASRDALVDPAALAPFVSLGEELRRSR
jgi:acetoacetyl-CoA synthetase